MKTVKIIAISFLILIQITLLTFAKIKATDAEKAVLEAQLIRKEAEELTRKAAQLEESALKAAADAVMQRNESERLLAELQKCQSK